MLQSKNAKLLHALSLQADTLSCTTAKNEFPVLLRPIAERRRVTSVEFRPLLVDAMLTTHSEGFRILFDSKGNDPLELNKQYTSENRHQMMPPRLRFSLAHEIAHTFFYDLSERPPKLAKQFRPGGGFTELENLENNCNKLAAQMLLPTSMLRAALRAMKEVTPQALVDIAQRAAVSIEALVRRLSDQNTLLADPYYRGCIVLVRESNGDPFVRAIARPPKLNIARGLRLMRPGERWQLTTSDGTSLQPRQFTSMSRVRLNVETSQSTSQEYYQIVQSEVARSNSVVWRLLTFEQVEQR
jgi:Zn-dependent peptidase ImmA (M78 family)